MSAILKQNFTMMDAEAISKLELGQRIAFKSKAMGGHSVVILEKSQVNHLTVFLSWFGFGPLAGLKYSLSDVVGCLEKYDIEALSNSKDYTSTEACNKIVNVMKKYFGKTGNKEGLATIDRHKTTLQKSKKFNSFEFSLRTIEEHLLCWKMNQPSWVVEEETRTKIDKLMYEYKGCTNRKDQLENFIKRKAILDGLSERAKEQFGKHTKELPTL
jgi:hypothetical protein